MENENGKKLNGEAISPQQPLNVIAAIGAELGVQWQLAENIPEKSGMFTVRTANRTIQEAANRPDPVPLWMTLWYEGEVCCLFADSNLGKSIYAVQIASSITKTRKVLYFDFELSDKQFQLRYTNMETGKCHEFPPDSYHVEIARDFDYPDGSFEDAVIMEIEQLSLKADCRILIIDNLSYLCMTSEKGEDAGRLMSRLMELKRRHGLSMLILAHTPKRQLNMPITQNDLAGSKKFYNFFDSVFAIGKSAKDGNLRYIKQLIPSVPGVPPSQPSRDMEVGQHRKDRQQKEQIMRYELQRYRTMSDRHTCPKCGGRHCFTYYVDENNQPLDKTVGRCDHESECGYHYPPKEYFSDHPELKCPKEDCPHYIRTAKPMASGKQSGKSFGTIPNEYVVRSRSDSSHLIQFLLSHQVDNAENVSRVLNDYRIGSTRDGSTIFWQIDINGHVRTGKIIQYKRENGHRIKDKGVNWVHSLLKRRSVIDEKWTLAQCLFGEHLLSQVANQGKVVAVVESEKTAIICAIQYPDCVWLATGGKSQLSPDKMKVLADTTIDQLRQYCDRCHERWGIIAL